MGYFFYHMYVKNPDIATGRKSDQVLKDRCGAGVGPISIILLRFGQKIVKFVHHLTRKTPLSGSRGRVMRVNTNTLCLVVSVNYFGFWTEVVKFFQRLIGSQYFCSVCPTPAKHAIEKSQNFLAVYEIIFA